MTSKLIVLTGQRFGKLVVQDHYEIKKAKTFWKCKCDCSNEKLIRAECLRNGKITDCGCVIKVDNLTGQRFGNLLVTGVEKVYKKGHYRFLQKCLCDCGNTRYAQAATLKRGLNKTCGKCTQTEDLKGMRVGKVLVIKFLMFDEECKSKWECLCDCGNKFVAYGDLLKSGNIISCGCLVNYFDLNCTESHFDKFFYDYKNRAKNKGIPFELSKKTFREITLKNCYYCNKPPEYRKYKVSKKFPGFYANGLDRVDNFGGYTIENVFPCCAQCNKIKINYTLDNFLNKIKSIYENLKLEKYTNEENINNDKL